MTITLIPHVQQSDPDGKLIALTDATSITGAGFTLANGEIRSVKSALSFEQTNVVSIVASAAGKSSRTLQVKVIPAAAPAPAPTPANTAPVLNLAATATITTGETTIATLSVTDPDPNQTFTFELTSNPGSVAQIVGNTLRFVSASVVGSYVISARAFDGIAYSAVKTITVTVQAPVGNFVWGNEFLVTSRRPDMTNPIVIDSDAQLAAAIANYSELPPGDTVTPLSPAGPIHLFSFPGRNVVFDARNMSTITKPVKILECLNQWIIGGDWELAPVANGGVNMLANVVVPGGGAANNYRKANVNPYPRPVGGSALQLSASHVTLIEGVNMDATGHNTDLVVLNTIAGQTPQQAFDTRRMYCINSRLSGWRGHAANHTGGLPDGSPIGDGAHADALQYQSQTAWNEVICENVMMFSGQEGFAFTSVTKWPLRTIYHRCAAMIDLRYVDTNQEMWNWIAPYGGNAQNINIKDCWSYITQTYAPSVGEVVSNKNHMIIAATVAMGAPTNFLMYFTDADGGWGNAWGETEGVPLANGVEIDLATQVFNTGIANPTTKVARHAGFKQIPGLLVDGTYDPSSVPDYAPANRVGKNYKIGEVLY